VYAVLIPFIDETLQEVRKWDMDLGLQGKVALVTGGSGGIGAEICMTMASEGARVVVGYFRNVKSAEDVVRAIEVEGGSGLAVKVDVRDIDSVRGSFQRVLDVFGGLDVLVNCAGVAVFNPLSNFPEADWSNVIDTNLKGIFLCCKAVIPYFRERGGGDIVNISSLAASTGSFEGSAYAASKAGVNSLTLSMALELADTNIRVNAVAPGRIATKFRRTYSGPYFEYMLEQTPQKRLGSPEEVANAVVFIASRACPFITGETLYVTGGLHAVYLRHVVPDRDSKLGGTSL
jgi:3-oxoacyl-[acyl-carrier protein] reductase